MLQRLFLFALNALQIIQELIICFNSLKVQKPLYKQASALLLYENKKIANAVLLYTISI